MWPVELYQMVSNPSGSPITYRDLFESYQALSTPETMAVHAVATLVLGALVLGLLPGYGTRALGTSRRSPIISFCIGVPAAVVLAGLLGAGVVIADTNLGVFFGMPLVVITLTLLPAWTALGYVTLGAVVGDRLGLESLWTGVVLGALFCGLLTAVPPLLFATTALTASLGVGAGVRSLLSHGNLGHREERVVPPAEKV